MCVDKPNPTHQNGKIFYPTQSNPWMDPTHVHVWSLPSVLKIKSICHRPMVYRSPKTDPELVHKHMYT